ncbi:MAG: cupin domain-containing protein [Xanthobacteraceae bacterium]
MHLVGRLSETKLDPGPFAGKSTGLSRFPLVGRAQGSPHQSMTVLALAPGGKIERHMRAFETGVYVLEGGLTLQVAGREETLGPDDYGFVEYGVPHSCSNAGSTPARWFEVSAPAPGSDHDDIAFVGPEIRGLETSLPFRRGHFDLAALPKSSSAIGLAGFSATNVGAAALQLIMEREFGPSQFNLMVVQYAEGGYINDHDHAFEEGFFFLTGEIDCALDGKAYTLRAGDYCWSSVTSMHNFKARGSEPVRWLETQAPQPPTRHQARFKAEWAKLVKGG